MNRSRTLMPRLRLQMRGELKHLQHELGTSSVYVTHDQAEAMTLWHRVAVMDKGKLQQFETPLDIYNRPANRFVAEFVGSPGLNFFDGRIDAGRALFEGEDVCLELQNGLERFRGRTEPVTLGIRPEHIDVSITQRENCLAASVYGTALMGSETFVFLQIGQRKIIARAPGDFRAVWVQFDTTKAHLFDPVSGKRL